MTNVIAALPSTFWQSVLCVRYLETWVTLCTAVAQARNGESRTRTVRLYTGHDVGKGKDAPIDFTYGEFPLPLFSKLVDRACELLAR